MILVTLSDLEVLQCFCMKKGEALRDFRVN